MVKLKEDKQVGQTFIELKHMAVVTLLNYLKTKEMLKNCKATQLGCVLTLPIYRGWEQHGKGREAGDKGTGSGRAGYGRREILTPLSPPTVQSYVLFDCDLFFKMDTKLFDELYEKVRPLIEKKNTNMRDAISAHERLCVTFKVFSIWKFLWRSYV